MPALDAGIHVVPLTLALPMMVVLNHVDRRVKHSDDDLLVGRAPSPEIHDKPFL
ncbi:hypothetical protein [Magnetospirillum gryphiswaldense]|uniref:hypothetical protein n=1 Tax=Magnetospirillum gryphiswaldense TaxID=55518 RepID=UPI00131A21B9|nr:hypothetical protein [Magnetospirillum gryphiswaldense]